MTAIATKTRERLLDVARQLFASNGVERTTMNDIAAASDKGRRTIYTYFKNKKEIYDAVIEREAEQLVVRLRDIVHSSLDPVEKFKAYIEARFDVTEETLQAPTATSQLISYITLDYKRLERVRRLAVEKERELFKTMINQGVESGVFDESQAISMPTVYQIIFQGVDFCHLRSNFDNLGVTPETLREDVSNFMLSKLITDKNRFTKI